MAHRARKARRRLACMALAWSLLGGGAAFAESTFSQDFRLWSPVFVTAKLPASFLAHMEVQPRFVDLDENGQMGQLILRPALGYQLTEHLSIWQGYAWVSNSDQQDENRIYQQILYSRTFETFKIVSRTRLEQRWIDDLDGTAVRFRTMLRGQYPLRMAPGWALVASNEIFVHLNTVGSRGPEAGFDQNRLFVGVNRSFSKSLDMDVGYLNQLVDSRTIPNLANQMNHTILLQLFINL